ncbi:hypothetical protein ACQ4M4_07110 [Leptolyngbya sp. AN02str]|uniref:hypothetical protein n=1 Tax=Leptolyngbya sp. AN02str TaxID=3423363 RepID=UPI003D3207ED
MPFQMVKSGSMWVGVQRLWAVPALAVVVAGLAIACQTQTLPPDTAQTSPPDTATPSATANIPATDEPTVYTNSEYGFSFTYPEGYVLEAQSDPRMEEDPEQKESLDLWTAQNYSAIRSNVYEGSELPANVNVSVYAKPESVALQDWIRQGNRFVEINNPQSTQLAGQDAIAFSSTGLYEHQNIVLASPDGANVVVINLARFDEENEAYKPAFETVVSTFAFQ